MVRLPAFCVSFLRIHVSLFRIPHSEFSSSRALATFPAAFIAVGIVSAFISSRVTYRYPFGASAVTASI